MRVSLVPVGPENTAVCSEIAELLGEWVGAELDLADAVAMPETEAGEDSLASGFLQCREVVRRLAGLARDRPVLAIVDSELRDERGNPVSGASQQGGRAGILTRHAIHAGSASGYIGHSDRMPFLAWYALHEIGHLAGIGHCGAAGCVMQSQVHLHRRISPERPFCHWCATLWEIELGDSRDAGE